MNSCLMRRQYQSMHSMLNVAWWQRIHSTLNATQVMKRALGAQCGANCKTLHLVDDKSIDTPSSH